MWLLAVLSITVLTGYVTGGRLRQKDGSGTMMITPMYVQVGSAGVKTFDLRYKAATRLRNAQLSIIVPKELLRRTAIVDGARRS